MQIWPGQAILTREQFKEFLVVIAEAKNIPICAVMAEHNVTFTKIFTQVFKDLLLEVKEENPDARIEVHDINGNHHLHLVNPQSVSNIVTDFLKSEMKSL